MQEADNLLINQAASQQLLVEIKLNINQKLYKKGAITEEMYTKAKDIILRRCETSLST